MINKKIFFLLINNWNTFMIELNILCLIIRIIKSDEVLSDECFWGSA
jgi:hypothetical protein